MTFSLFLSPSLPAFFSRPRTQTANGETIRHNMNILLSATANESRSQACCANVADKVDAGSPHTVPPAFRFQCGQLSTPATKTVCFPPFHGMTTRDRILFWVHPRPPSILQQGTEARRRANGLVGGLVCRMCHSGAVQLNSHSLCA